MDGGSIVVQPFRIPSMSLAPAPEIVTRIETAILKLPETVGVVSRTGRSDISSDHRPGLVPMIWATGVGSRLQRPLAAVVVSGVVTSSVPTLIVLPVLGSWFGGAPERAVQRHGRCRGQDRRLRSRPASRLARRRGRRFMEPVPQTPRDDAIAIWRAGVEAVRGDVVVRRHVEVHGDSVRIGQESVPLGAFARIVVVGGGKAADSMAIGLEGALAGALDRVGLEGRVLVPAGTSRNTRYVEALEVRPAGCNEPTVEAAAAAAAMLRHVRSLSSRDWCIVLLSGGGSALMPAPIEGLDLDAKIAVTRFLSAAGADIGELNTVRRALSRIKGGGLARACTAGRLDTLAISDVAGDPPEVIAGGPTVASPTGPQDALRVLGTFDPSRDGVPESVYGSLEVAADGSRDTGLPERPGGYHLLASASTAVEAAAVEARRRGYEGSVQVATAPEGDVAAVARAHVRDVEDLRRSDRAWFRITAGEPTVRLAPEDIRGRGGRNQQLVLEILQRLGAPAFDGLCVLSGGTDGEDGPTDAAGGIVDGPTARAVDDLDLDGALRRNDAYPLLDRAGGLLRTGPTGTNVGDLRVILGSRVLG